MCILRRVACRWKKCKKKMRECDRGVHEENCRKRMVPCGLGCGDMFPFAEVEGHKARDCPRRQVPCVREQCIRKVRANRCSCVPRVRAACATCPGGGGVGGGTFARCRGCAMLQRTDWWRR